MPTTLKVLKGNTGSFLTLGRNVSDATLKAEVTKAETDKWNGIELQSLSAAQGTIARVERQSAACEKIFAIHLYDKGLISKIHEELEQFHSIKDDSPIKNGKGPEQIYLKRRHADDWGQCKKMQKIPTIINHQKNANRYHNESHPKAIRISTSKWQKGKKCG